MVGILPRSLWVSILLSCQGAGIGWLGGREERGRRGEGERLLGHARTHVSQHVRAATTRRLYTPRARRGEQAEPRRAEPWLMRRGNASLTLPVAKAW